MLQVLGCGSLPFFDMQHSRDRMLQDGQELLQVSQCLQHSPLDPLQVVKVLQQIGLDLQQNLRSGHSANKCRPPAQEVGHLRMGEMLQVEADLQQNKKRMLQI